MTSISRWLSCLQSGQLVDDVRLAVSWLTKPVVFSALVITVYLLVGTIALITLVLGLIAILVTTWTFAVLYTRSKMR